MYIYMYMYVCMYVCMYIYIHIYIEHVYVCAGEEVGLMAHVEGSRGRVTTGEHIHLYIYTHMFIRIDVPSHIILAQFLDVYYH